MRKSIKNKQLSEQGENPKNIKKTKKNVDKKNKYINLLSIVPLNPACHPSLCAQSSGRVFLCL